MTIEDVKTNPTDTEVSDDIATWFAKRQKDGELTRRDYRAAFLAARSNVIEAREAGYSFKIIWEHMHEIGRIPFRYETFLRYAHKYITTPSNKNPL